MAKIMFYPVGNADCTLIQFSDDRLMLIDYCHRYIENEDEDKKINLQEILKQTLREIGRNSIDVVAFTHADADHVDKAEELFWLDHAPKYQDDERIKIGELWVPACFITEENLEDTARVIRQEARHRLKNIKGIRVFGKSDLLNDWIKDNVNNSFACQDYICTAGKLESNFVTRSSGNAEIFIHSPFKYHVEEEDRNNASLVMHITFFEQNNKIKLFLSGDIGYEALENIVKITEEKDNSERLYWNIFHIPHHCSYNSLAEEKGRTRTEPSKFINSLYKDYAAEKCIIVSPSMPIPSQDTDQPPHFQAKAFYKECANDKSGSFLVTMEHPKKEKPEPIVIDVISDGFNIKGASLSSKSSSKLTEPKKVSEIKGTGRFA